jgi:hypothetical protein
MKFIYNNTKYEIDIDDFISVYHLRTLIKKKYGFIIDESYSITDLEGIIYKPDGTVIKNDETVIIKKKLRGGQDFNPYDAEVSNGLLNPIALITAIVSGFYYFKYINGLILSGANDIEYLIFQKDKNITEYGKKQKGGKNEGEMVEMSNITKNFVPPPITSMNNLNLKQLKNILTTTIPNITNTQIQEILEKNPDINQINNLNTKATKIANAMKPKPSIFKIFLESFKEGIQDSQFDKVNCAFDRLFPEKELNRDYNNLSNWNMVATSAIFFTYFLTVLIALFINPISTKYCGTPNAGVGVLTFVMILIPLALIYLIPYIVKGLDFLFEKIFHLASGPVFSNYKLATSNIILIVMLIVFCFINIKGISPIFGAMIPIFMLIFAIIDFILKKSGVLRILSRKLGNIITNTEKIPNDLPDMFDASLHGIKRSHRIGQTDNVPAPECYYRFNIFHSLLYGVIVSLVGRGFFSIVYSANIKYCCPK